MKNGTIYTLAHPITKEVVYVGKTCYSLHERLTGHITDSKRHNRKICTWIRKLKKSGLEPLIEEVEQCKCEEAVNMEILYIALFKSWGFNLKNHTIGGEGPTGYKHSEKTKLALSKKNKGENNRFYGKRHSEETKKKISEKGKGRKMSDEFKEKRRQYMKKYKPSKESIEKVAKSHRIPIVQLDKELKLINSFSSIREAQKTIKGTSDAHISSCCKKKRKTHMGFIWMYTSEYLITHIS